MKPRHVQTWVWWLLPFLVARALMPVGFMASAQDGEFQVVFCSSGSVLANELGSDDAALDRSHQDRSHDSSHDQSHSPSHDQNFSCPFAHAAAAPLLDLSGSEAIAFTSTADRPLPAAPPYLAAGPPRAVSARGPPQLA